MSLRATWWFICNRWHALERYETSLWAHAQWMGHLIPRDLFSCQNEAFKKMTGKIYTDISVSCRGKLKRRLTTFKERMVVNVQAFLSSTKVTISLTVNAWWSEVCRWYMTVIAHRMDKRWTLKRHITDVSKVSYPHTGDATKASLRQVNSN